MWFLGEITSYVEELFKGGLGPLGTTLSDVCVQRAGLCTDEQIPDPEVAGEQKDAPEKDEL